jgi:hypothetical protein
MKTERKHELQTNVLADWLGQHIEQIRPYGKNIAIGIGLILVAWIAYSFVQYQKSIAAGATWRDYFAATMERNPDQRNKKIDAVATMHADQVPGLWAVLNAAQGKLSAGCARLFTDREIARKELSDAKEGFQEVAEKAGQPDLRVFALYGLAQTFEAMGELKQASEKFRQVHSTAPETAFGKAAKARADYLASSSVEQFYDWFGKQTPAVLPPFGNRDILPPEFGDLSDRPGSRTGLDDPFGGFGKGLDLPESGNRSDETKKSKPDEPSPPADPDSPETGKDQPEVPKPEEPKPEEPKPEQPRATDPEGAAKPESEPANPVEPGN